MAELRTASCGCVLQWAPVDFNSDLSLRWEVINVTRCPRAQQICDTNEAAYHDGSIDFYSTAWTDHDEHLWAARNETN